MVMKIFSVKSLLIKVSNVALRFPFTLFFLIGLSVLFFININGHSVKIEQRIWAFFYLGIPMSVAVSLFSGSFKNHVIKAGANLLAIVILLVYCNTLPEKYAEVHFYQSFALGITFVLTCFFVSYLQKDGEISFWEFSKSSIIQLIISGVFAVVLWGGLSLAVFSLQQLFKVDIQDKVYANLATVCFILFAPVYFLGNLTPEQDMHLEKYTFNTFLKILGLYILLPILAIYTVILYAYLAQIIFKWELPNGWVSTLVSILSLGGFLCMLILYPLRLKNVNKFVNFLSGYFPVILFPLLILMSVGIFRRLGDYGITINRLYVLILNVWLYGISIYLFISKAKHLKWIVISFTLILFLSSAGPWSVFNITKRTMITEISQILNKTKLLKDGKVIDNTNRKIKLDSLSSAKLSEEVRYITHTYGAETLQPYFNFTLKGNSSYNITQYLGIKDNPNEESHYFNANLDEYSFSTDTEGYKSLYFVDFNFSNNSHLFKNDSIEIVKKNTTIFLYKNKSVHPYIEIPLKQKIDFIMKNEGNDKQYNLNDMSIKGPNYKLILNSINGKVESDSISITRIEFHLFLK